jgi:hypothetical protein
MRGALKRGALAAQLRVLFEHESECGHRLRLQRDGDADTLPGFRMKRAQHGLLRVLGADEPGGRRDELLFGERGDRGRRREGDEQAREPPGAGRTEEALGLWEVERQVVVHQAVLQARLSE